MCDIGKGRLKNLIDGGVKEGLTGTALPQYLRRARAKPLRVTLALCLLQ